MTQNPIRLLLVDDHTLFRTGLRLLLQSQSDFEIVGEAADGLEGVKRARQLQPDVVLLDLNLPGLSGLEALPLIREEVPHCAVLILTVSEETEELVTALQTGARGFLPKNIEAEVLTTAIRKAAQGEDVITEAMTAKLVALLRTKPAASAPAIHNGHEKLTPRERETLQALARGESNKEIARHFDLAESTVKIHVQNILKKLHLNSRVQAAVYAVEHGLADN